jgi:hypothetical protein
MMYNKFVNLEKGFEEADREKRINQDLLNEKLRMGFFFVFFYLIFLLFVYISKI